MLWYLGFTTATSDQGDNPDDPEREAIRFLAQVSSFKGSCSRRWRKRWVLCLGRIAVSWRRSISSASKALWARQEAGRPPEDRRALARAFLAKAVWDLPTTRHLIDRLGPALRRLCGWSRLGAIPSEATFSRAFAEFAEARLADRMHEALVVDALGGTLTCIAGRYRHRGSGGSDGQGGGQEAEAWASP